MHADLITELLLFVGIVCFGVIGRIGRRLPRTVHRVLWITTLVAIGTVIILTVWTRTVYHS